MRKAEPAIFSDCRTWRYELTRDTGSGAGLCAFIGLNPSTADETQDDPTIRRCIRYTRDWGYARFKMLNVYAYRSTDPSGLLAVADPIGPDNDETIDRVCGMADLVVCVWGAFSSSILRPARVERVLDIVIQSGQKPYCLGTTKNGLPRHPLYVKADQLPVPFGWSDVALAS